MKRRRNDVVLKLKCSLLNPVKNKTERIATIQYVIRYIQGFSKGNISTLIESGTILMVIFFIIFFFFHYIIRKVLIFLNQCDDDFELIEYYHLMPTLCIVGDDLSKLEGYHLLCQYET